MQEIPFEYIQKYGIRETADFFAELLMKKRMSGYVPVLVEDFLTSFLFVEADVIGRPKKRYHQSLSFLGLPKMMTEMSEISPYDTTTVLRKEFEIEKPLVYYEFRPNWEPGEMTIFLWSGRLVSQREVPISSLDVKELLKLSQEVIRKRDGIIMNEAFVNSFIK